MTLRILDYRPNSTSRTPGLSLFYNGERCGGADQEPSLAALQPPNHDAHNPALVTFVTTTTRKHTRFPLTLTPLLLEIRTAYSSALPSWNYAVRRRARLRPTAASMASSPHSTLATMTMPPRTSQSLRPTLVTPKSTRGLGRACCPRPTALAPLASMAHGTR
ncbi:hypothetical protein C8R44DRAFT_888461 [Mycena epipterygia]|nr:hypothetical protein C8R44DRAFT_888461 [Mycena epipterygia]